MKILRHWYPDEDLHETLIITKDGEEIIGTAVCHPDDKDMKNEYAGETISRWRAMYKYGKHMLKHELRPQLKILKHLFDCMKQSKEYNPRSNEVRLIRRQIAQLEKEIADLKYDLEGLQGLVREYIDAKDDFYKKIRAKREKDKTL